MDGQMSIFDFPEFLPKEVVKSDFPCDGCKYDDEHGCCSYNDSDDYCVLGDKREEKIICKFSNHSCNKEELWEIAESFDDITCQKKCCRSCDVQLCGARCNGSSEQQKKKSIIWHYSLTAIYTECPYCHSHNSEDERTGECRFCHNLISFLDPIIKKSRDVIECEKLGLRGGVAKDEKGHWYEVKT